MRNRIKEVRKKHGDTLKNLAQKINYDYSNLSKIERGVYHPSISILKQISELYEVDLPYLLGYEQEESKKHVEEQFIYDLGRYAEEQLDTYTFTLDGQALTKEEIFLMIDVIRTLRRSVSRIQSAKQSEIKKKESRDSLP